MKWQPDEKRSPCLIYECHIFDCDNVQCQSSRVNEFCGQVNKIVKVKIIKVSSQRD